MPGGGVPYCLCWGGPWGEHGVCPFDEPLRARGRSFSGHHVVPPVIEDCTPDLRRGLVTVCRLGREVIVWGAEAGGAEGGVAGWCGGLFLIAPGGSGPLGGPSSLWLIVGVWSLDV